MESVIVHNLVYGRFTARPSRAKCCRCCIIHQEQPNSSMTSGGMYTYISWEPLIDGLELEDKYNIYHYYSKQNRCTVHYIQEWGTQGARVWPHISRPAARHELFSFNRKIGLSQLMLHRIDRPPSLGRRRSGLMFYFNFRHLRYCLRRKASALSTEVISLPEMFELLLPQVSSL